ncbi:MAG TPA: hypothetical protein VJM53_04130, partial [Burkholderiales bacterium]|nr:hypothetical protein [Burkholderiales bacterium]
MIYGRFNPREFEGPFASPTDAGTGLSLEGKGYALQLAGPRAQLYSDAQLVVACIGHPRIGDGYIGAETFATAYRQNGSTAVEQLCGNFSIVVLDALTRQALLYTDRFAAEAMCHSEQDGSLYFCDRADVLAKRLGHAIDEQALFNYLYFHAIPAPRTAFVHVNRLEASTRLIFADAGRRIARYWQPHFIEAEQRPLQELKVEFRTLIEMAVK